MKLFIVWVYPGAEWHFRSATKAADPNCTIQGYCHDPYLFFLETDMEIADISSLASVSKVELNVPMGAPSGIVAALDYKYESVTGDPDTDNKIKSRYADVSDLLGSEKFYRKVKFGDLPNLSE